MPKQEEVREGMIDQLGLIFPISRDIATKAAVELLKTLHSKGVVIKVDRGLPKNPYTIRVCIETYDRSCRRLLNAGYVAVEPLIKEVSNG